LKTVCELNIRVKSYQKKEHVKTTSLSFSHWRDSFGSTGSTVRTMDLCIADMFLCHYINATKIDCELDPRVKKLLYLCSCPYVSMLEHSLCLCPYVSMLVPLCFYDQNFFYAPVLMFLCLYPYVSMIGTFTTLLSLCFYAP